MSVVATFEKRLGEANVDKLVIDITNDVVGPETIKIAWGVVGPTGVLKAQDIGTPDFTAVAPAAVNTVTVDLPVLGSITAQGDYQVLVRITRDSDDTLLVNHDETYDYSPFNSCGDVVQEAFSENVYCDAKALVIKDDTLYGSYTPDKTITVQHPTIPGVVTPADTVSTTTPFQIALTYRNVAYTVTYDVDFSLTQVEGSGASAVTFIEQHSLNKSVSVNITCVSICDIQDCIDDERRNLEQKAIDAGGVHNMKASDRDKLNLLNLYTGGYHDAAQCSDTDGKTYYYNKIKDLLNCTGNCCDDGSISEIVPEGELVYIQGADGKSVLNGVVDPTTEGNDGDFYINRNTWQIFGPKAGGTWPAGVDLIGADGADGSDGNTILNGAVDPTTEGVNGDFYINTVTFQIFGPKTGGAWGSGTDLIAGGANTAWTPFTTELQTGWITGTGDGALQWRRLGNHLHIKGDLSYTLADPGTTEVALLDKTWLLSGVALPPEGIHGFVVQDTNNEIHGVIRESKTGSTMLIWFAPAAAFAVSTVYRVNVTIPIE